MRTDSLTATGLMNVPTIQLVLVIVDLLTDADWSGDLEIYRRRGQYTEIRGEVESTRVLSLSPGASPVTFNDTDCSVGAPYYYSVWLKSTTDVWTNDEADRVEQYSWPSHWGHTDYWYARTTDAERLMDTDQVFYRLLKVMIGEPNDTFKTFIEQLMIFRDSDEMPGSVISEMDYMFGWPSGEHHHYDMRRDEVADAITVWRSKGTNSEIDIQLTGLTNHVVEIEPGWTHVAAFDDTQVQVIDPADPNIMPNKDLPTDILPYTQRSDWWQKFNGLGIFCRRGIIDYPFAADALADYDRLIGWTNEDSVGASKLLPSGMDAYLTLLSWSEDRPIPEVVKGDPNYSIPPDDLDDDFESYSLGGIYYEVTGFPRPAGNSGFNIGIADIGGANEIVPAVDITLAIADWGALTYMTPVAMATLLQTKIRAVCGGPAPTVTVTWDAIFGWFVIDNTAAGETITIDAPVGAIANWSDELFGAAAYPIALASPWSNAPPTNLDDFFVCQSFYITIGGGGPETCGDPIITPLTAYPEVVANPDGTATQSLKMECLVGESINMFALPPSGAPVFSDFRNYYSSMDVWVPSGQSTESTTTLANGSVIGFWSVPGGGGGSPSLTSYIVITPTAIYWDAPTVTGSIRLDLATRVTSLSGLTDAWIALKVTYDVEAQKKNCFVEGILEFANIDCCQDALTLPTLDAANYLVPSFVNQAGALRPMALYLDNLRFYGVGLV